jgi:hypothetical protein
MSFTTPPFGGVVLSATGFLPGNLPKEGKIYFLF